MSQNDNTNQDGTNPQVAVSSPPENHDVSKPLPEATIQTPSLSADPSRIYDPTKPLITDEGHPDGVDLDAKTFRVNKVASPVAEDEDLPLMDEPMMESFSPLAAKKPINDSPEVPEEIFTPPPAAKTEEDSVWSGILDDAYRQRNDIGYDNVDKAPTAVPRGNIADMDATLLATVSRNPDTAIADIRNMVTDINIIDRARSELTMASGLLTKALERIDTASAPLEETLQRSIVHPHGDVKVRIQDTAANISSIHKDKTKVNLNLDKDSSVTISALLGANIRKYYLYNSGITINLRRVHLREFSDYVRSITESDAEYGRQFGGFYYLYADLHITKHVIEHLLPLAICGSSFKEWRDTDKLMKAISHQDYHVLLWGIALTMHPKGIEVGYACGNPDCGHVMRETVDLFKLRYQNVNLITKEMRDFIVANPEVTTTSLAQYKEAMNANRVLTTKIGSDRRIDVELKQASIFDYLQVGTEFYTDLESVCNTSDVDAVNSYLTYNIYKAYRPWINKITIYDNDIPYELENDGSSDAINGMNMFLDELQLHDPEFGDKIAEYIVDTKISHIAFHVNTCPNCNALPTTGREGFIPYDPQYNFFTHALSLLHQVR